MVINLDETISVTQNFVNDQNLELATRLLYYGNDNKELLVYWLEKLHEVSYTHWKIVRNKLRMLEGKTAKFTLENKQKEWQYKEEQFIKKQKLDQERQMQLISQIADLTKQLEALKTTLHNQTKHYEKPEPGEEHIHVQGEPMVCHLGSEKTNTTEKKESEPLQSNAVQDKENPETKTQSQ